MNKKVRCLVKPMIVIADRDFDYLRSVDSLHCCNFVLAANGDEAIAACHVATGSCLLILGAGLPGGEPLCLLHALRASGRRHGKVVLAAEDPTVEFVIDVFKAGACDFIKKPTSKSVVLSIVGASIGNSARIPTYWAQKLDRYLTKNLSDPNLSLATLQAHFAVSRSYLSKLFKAEIGMPFRHRLMRHRITEATRLIETTDEPIYMVAHRCGYRSQCRLTEAFTRYHGIAPRRYREAHRSHDPE